MEDLSTPAGPKKDYSSIKGKKVFLVEDDTLFTKIIKQKVSTIGCVFVNTMTGDESIPLIQKELPDVILLDILLPGGINGFAVLRKLKSDDSLKRIPVIILSNLSEPKDVQQGMELGAFRYIVKSTIEPKEILDHIESALTSTVR